MQLLETIQSDIIQAMKARDEKKLKALRMLSAAIKNEEIEKRPQELEEADILNVIRREVKKLNDAILQFKEGGREDLVKEYEEEAEILKQYTPKEMPEEEVRKVVQEKVSASEDKNFGNIMKGVMAELKGQADGGTVSRIVREEMEKIAD
ncbi:GatB/YqeY domain-containing protein [Patescibacteria group bacterium]|nr:GatB/YqeY domain-containing protein [Patescibacteria group bacterium]